MFSTSSWPALLSAALIGVLFSTMAAGTPPGVDTQASAALRDFVSRTLQASPSVQASASAVDAQEARSRGAAKSLFNPVVEFEYENSDIDTTTLELQQTLDWHGKRSARKNAGDAALAAARAAHQAQREQLAGEVLMALADLSRALQLEVLAADRVTLLQRFVSLHERRAAVGDIKQTELQLARLALAEARLQHADAAADTLKSHTALSRRVGRLPATLPALPSSPPAPSLEPEDAENMAAMHPAVRLAQLRAQAAKRRISMTDRNRRADPTIAIKGGREDQEALFGLRLEVPLQVRNDFSEEVETAQALSVQAEREAQDRFRDVLYQLKGAHRRLLLTRESLIQWQNHGQPHLKGYMELLDRLWESGEVGSSEYLAQMRQTLDTRIAGELVRAKAWSAWADWLNASGRVQVWLGISSLGDEQ